MVSSYHPSTRSSHADHAFMPESDTEKASRRTSGRTTVRNVGGSGRKKKTLIEELGGQQVITTTENTSYGSGTAVKPIQIRRTIEGDDLTAQMKNIIGGSSVPLSRFRWAILCSKSSC